MNTEHNDEATESNGGVVVGIIEDMPTDDDRAGDRAGTTGEVDNPADPVPADTMDLDPDAEQDLAESGRTASGWLRLTSLVLVFVAAVCAVVFGGLWIAAANNNTLSQARARDVALQAAETGAVNFTTLDYRNIQQGLDRWKQSATGNLLTELSSGLNTFEQQVQQSKVVTTGKVVDGALTSLDLNGGKAEAVVLVDVTVAPSTGQPGTKRLPLDVTLTNTGSSSQPVWKLSNLVQISSGTAGK